MRSKLLKNEPLVMWVFLTTCRYCKSFCICPAAPTKACSDDSDYSVLLSLDRKHTISQNDNLDKVDVTYKNLNDMFFYVLAQNEFGSCFTEPDCSNDQCMNINLFTCNLFSESEQTVAHENFLGLANQIGAGVEIELWMTVNGLSVVDGKWANIL